jgi:hypothetical protein
MNSRTVTAVLDAPPERVFGYMAEIRNLPEWATEFARELVEENGVHKGRNNLGEFVFEIHADAATGVIDMFAGPTADQLAVFPTRVVPMPGGRSAYSFTMFQGPDMPDELFESQHESLKREFENIERLVESLDERTT